MTTGKCDGCKPNKWDIPNQCSKPCSANCAVDTNNCHDTGNCKYPEGKTVVTCLNNYWGDDCVAKCNDGTKYFCKSTCKNVGTGTGITLSCTAGCDDGKFGTDCSQTCND